MVNLFKNNSWKFEVAKVAGGVSVLRFAEVIQKFEHFCTLFYLNDVTRRFCDVFILIDLSISWLNIIKQIYVL